MDPRVSSAERTGRRVSLGLYLGLVTVFTLICSVEVILQAWAHPPLPEPVDCRARAQSLIKGLENAKARARSGDNEQTSMELFRGGLGPDWELKNSLQQACAKDPLAARLIRELDQLRYAEEHAVRYEARELTRRRQRVSLFERELSLDPVPH